MRISKLFCIVVLLIFNSVFAQQKNDDVENYKKITSIASMGTIERLSNETGFSLIDYKKDNLLLFNMVIDQKTHLFLYDTGCQISSVSEEIGKDASSVGQFSIKDGFGKKKEAKVIIKDLYLDKICFKNTALIVTDLEELRKKTCFHIDGILGSNAINLCNWKINPVEEKMYFSNNPFKPESANYQVFDLEFYAASFPLVNLSIDKKKIWASIDTGFAGYLILNELKLNKSKKFPLKTGFGNYFATIADFTKQKVYKTTIDTVYAGKVALSNIKTFISGAKPSIGAKFFKDYITIFNFKEKKVFLTKITTLTDNEESEFNIKFFLNENNELTIQFLWEDEEIKKQDIKLGDKIISVNGIDCSSKNFENYCKAKQEFRDKSTIELVLQRGLKTKKVIINKKSMW